MFGVVKIKEEEIVYRAGQIPAFLLHEVKTGVLLPSIKMREIFVLNHWKSI